MPGFGQLDRQSASSNECRDRAPARGLFEIAAARKPMTRSGSPSTKPVSAASLITGDEVMTNILLDLDKPDQKSPESPSTSEAPPLIDSPPSNEISPTPPWRDQQQAD